MQSLWSTNDAARNNSELALRAYTSRLLGSDPTLVLHGGGNTSIKIGPGNEGGERVLYVKGTGSNLARVNESSFTPLRLHDVANMLTRERLSNAEMMHELDTCIVHRPAPRPSIETLLHAGLPFRCVEHTHADAVLAAMNIENIESVHADVYGDRAPLVPYSHSGHALARACMQAFRAHGSPNSIGLILAFHGVVAFGDNTHVSYENMIELVTRAENYLQAHGAWDISYDHVSVTNSDADALARMHAEINSAAGVPLVIRIADDAQSRAYARRADLLEISQQGPATPQHAVYTKRVPMVGRDVCTYAVNYRNYLDTHLGKVAGALIDAAPRIILDPEWGLIALGSTERDAKMAMEMYQHDIEVITRASAHGRYRSAPPAAIAEAEFEYGGYAKQLPIAAL
jgi:rhamnose utilization protein RhaD (predicted bifunctional aldolase and dehydrogenase)